MMKLNTPAPAECLLCFHPRDVNRDTKSGHLVADQPISVGLMSKKSSDDYIPCDSCQVVVRSSLCD